MLGGGVMQRQSLFPKIRTKVQEMVNGYVDMPQIKDTIDTYIVPPTFGATAGLVGALSLAKAALDGAAL